MKGHRYATLLCDLDEKRVLDVAQDRKEDSLKGLLESIPDEQRQEIEAVAMDMWEPYINAVQALLPEADIVHDKFHIAKYLGEAVDAVRKAENKEVGRAWAIKEMFANLWEFTYEKAARNYFRKWHWWATHSRLRPITQVAKMLKRHLDNILTYLKHRITNAAVEGINSRIQQVKSAARGFRNFKNYRIAILFFCGKLDLYP